MHRSLQITGFALLLLALSPSAQAAPAAPVLTDEFVDAADTVKRASWFCEGMVGAIMALITRVSGSIGEDPRRALFVNGIYGGPTNFSNGYHRPEELVENMPRAEKVARIGQTMFSGALHSAANYQKLQPDFANECDLAYDREIDKQLSEHEDASPLFGHQKDAFFIDNRLCRFMNQVDLNRYFWDEAMALTSVPLYEFYLRLPDRLKFDRILHRRILRFQNYLLYNKLVQDYQYNQQYYIPYLSILFYFYLTNEN